MKGKHAWSPEDRKHYGDLQALLAEKNHQLAEANRRLVEAYAQRTKLVEEVERLALKQRHLLRTLEQQAQRKGA